MGTSASHNRQTGSAGRLSRPASALGALARRDAQRILNRAARRLLAEQLDSDALPALLDGGARSLAANRDDAGNLDRCADMSRRSSTVRRSQSSAALMLSVTPASPS